MSERTEGRNPVATTDTMASIIERYRRLESALLYDTLHAMGLSSQLLAMTIQPLHIDMVVAGPAFTWKCAIAESKRAPAAGHLDWPESDYPMLAEMTPGGILVQDCGGDDTFGGLGENKGLSVKLAGCGGVVCDGGTRDKKALIAMGFPVFSRYSTCVIGWGRRFLDYQIPVRLSGHLQRWVTVNPGDFIFGDADGVLVIPKELTLEVLEGAERVAQIEVEQRARLHAGVPREEVYRVSRYGHIRRVVP
jgi:regulator of RNase E activity RraA